MRRKARVSIGGMVEQAIANTIYDFGLSVMQICGTSKNTDETIQAFVRIVLSKHFGINRFAVFTTSVHSLKFVLGVGNDPHEIDQQTIFDFIKTKDVDNCNHPSPKQGYDLIIRVGQYLFFFDDTSRARKFNQSDISILRRVANTFEKILVISRNPDSAVDTLTKLPGRVIGEKAIETIMHNHQKFVMGFASIDNAVELMEEHGHRVAQLAFVNVASFIQEWAMENRGLAALFSETDIFFVCAPTTNFREGLKALPHHISSEPCRTEMPLINVGVSIGYTIANAIKRPDYISGAKRRADFAMLAARRAGGNQTVEA